MAGGAKHEQSGAFARFLHSQVSGSLVLLACTVVALAWANSPWAESYFALIHTYAGVSWGDADFRMSLQHWVNDALMVVFFFVVGLEIKRELVVGNLSSFGKAVLPVAAAAGGVVLPASIYLSLNAGTEGAPGWGVPMATDIAFALGILALFGKRVPIGLKVFLTALAIADDIGAVLVIALFYTEQIRLGGLIFAAIVLGLLFLVLQTPLRRRVGIVFLLIVGVWAGVFASGVHATVAGILLAFLVPVQARIEPDRFMASAHGRLEELRGQSLTRQSMLSNEAQLDALEDLYDSCRNMRPSGLSLEHYLHPVQAFFVLPLFALFNAGVPITERIVDVVTTPVALGVILGLVLGKQLGILLFSWLAIRISGARLPEGVAWAHIYGAACLAGVGFTMSLFVSDLAFEADSLIGQAKVGILVASLLAGAWGWLVLHRTLPKAAPAGMAVRAAAT
jgi:NhaA family Na+:H+ antiporter